MPPAPRSPAYIPELDGIRAIAVILVFMNHFAPASGFDFLHRVGWVGVDVFFVLSGFLITGILRDSRARPDYYSRFYARRTLRIFPLYYVLLTGVLLVMALSKGGYQLHTMLAQWGSPLWLYSYLGNIKTAVSNLLPPNYFVPMWSLHVEEQFYLIFPFLVRHISRKNLQRTLIVVGVAAPLIRLALWKLYPNHPLLQYMLLPCRMDGLAVGALISMRHKAWSQWLNDYSHRTTRSFVLPAGLALLIVACAVFQMSGGEYNTTVERTIGYSLFAIAFGCLLYWVLLYRATLATAFLNCRLLQYIGKISYGIYLLQIPAGSLVYHIGHYSRWHMTEAGLNSIPGFLATACVCLVLATASWYLLERPILGLKRRFA